MEVLSFQTISLPLIVNFCHLTILGVRANLERLSAEEFERLDQEQKPINSGVTTYKGDPTQGQNGRLILTAYNLNLHTR